jgi:hypothetical protein
MNGPRWPELRRLQPGIIPLGPLAPGEIFAAALAALRGHAALLFGASFILIAIARITLEAIVGPLRAQIPRLPRNANSSQLNDYIWSLAPVSGLTTAFAGLALLLVTGLATVVVGQAVLGRRITFAAAIAQLRPLLLPLLAVAVLLAAGVALGLLAFIVPGVWLAVVGSLAVPALVLERSTTTVALNRSRELVRGNWWRLFAMLAAGVLMAVALELLMGMLVGAIVGPASSGLLTWLLAGQIVADAIAVPFIATVSVLLYIDRRFATDDLALELARAAGLKP